jgi:hypothetical protein
MALTKVNEIRRDYNQNKKSRYEQEFAEKTGSLRGFRNSDEYKRFEKAKRNAIYRYKAKLQDEKIVGLIGVNEEVSEVVGVVENVKVTDSGSPFFKGLSYGDDDTSMSIETMELLKEENRGRVTAIVDATEIGEPLPRSFRSSYDYQEYIKKVYKLCRQAQKVNGKFSSDFIPIVSTFSATVNGREIVFVKISSRKKWMTKEDFKNGQK